MSKSASYYCDHSLVSELETEYGDQFEGLERQDKYILIAVIAFYCQVQFIGEPDHAISILSSIDLYPLKECVSDLVKEFVQVIDLSVPVDRQEPLLRGLLLALSAQLVDGDFYPELGEPLPLHLDV